MEAQQRFDFDREQQQAILQAVELPDVVVSSDGKGVSRHVLKSVLVAIDRQAGERGTCYASCDTLAAELQLSRRTVIRAVRALRKKGIVQVREDGRRQHRWISWPQLMEHHTGDPTGDPEPPTGDTRSPIGDPGGVTGDPEPVTPGHHSRRRSVTQGHHSRRRLVTPGHQLVTQGHPIHASMNDEYEYASCMDAVSDSDSGRGWTLRQGIDPTALRDPECVSELHALAVEQGRIPPGHESRLEFFALCHSCFRNRQQEGRPGGLRNPVGFLHAKLGDGNWRDQADDQHDRAWAKEVITRMERRERGEPTRPAVAIAAQMSVAAEPVRTRDEAIEEAIDRSAHDPDESVRPVTCGRCRTRNLFCASTCRRCGGGLPPPRGP